MSTSVSIPVSLTNYLGDPGDLRILTPPVHHILLSITSSITVPWHDASPPATSQSQIICLSKAAERGAIQDRRWYKRITKFLRTFYRACQVTVMISPLFVTFPFMYLTRKIFPLLRRKYVLKCYSHDRLIKCLEGRKKGSYWWDWCDASHVSQMVGLCLMVNRSFGALYGEVHAMGKH